MSQPKIQVSTKKNFYSETFKKPDGRDLHLFSWNEITAKPFEEEKVEEEAPVQHSHMRWHPTRREWITYSAARQGRTFKPPAEYCPLCVSKEGSLPTEVPFSAFDIAIFDNKFPAFRADTTMAPEHEALATAPAQGKCEVIVYSSEHEGNLGQLPQDRVELLVDAWIHRYKALLGNHNIKFVMPFENRGEEAGVTLHHPHGQIYAYSQIPPVIEQSIIAYREKPVLQDMLAKTGDKYIIFKDEYMSAYVPPFARYPYEIWISANRQTPGPWDFSEAEKSSYAAMLKKVVTLYDKFFGKITPYLYSMHASPVGEEEYFEFSGQFYALLRDPKKMKYLGGCEQGSGAFLSDVLPEDAAKQLREVSL